MHVGIIGLNVGTAFIAQVLAKKGYKVTLFTALEDLTYGVKLIDEEPHVKLNLISNNELFNIDYLMDILGIEIIQVNNLSSVKVINDREVLYQNKSYYFDKIFVGSEIELRSCSNNYVTTDLKDVVSTCAKIKLSGNDSFKILELALLFSEQGLDVCVDKSVLPLDNDLINLMNIKVSERCEDAKDTVTISTDLPHTTPEVYGNEVIIGKSFKFKDYLSGSSQIVMRDYHVLTLAKLKLLEFLGRSIDYRLVRFEMGWSRNYIFTVLGITKSEALRIFPEISTSKITYRADDQFITVKSTYYKDRLLGVQLLIRGISCINWISLILALIMVNPNFLILDQGYEFLNVHRGLLENIILNLMTENRG